MLLVFLCDSRIEFIRCHRHNTAMCVCINLCFISKQICVRIKSVLPWNTASVAVDMLRACVCVAHRFSKDANRNCYLFCEAICCDL